MHQVRGYSSALKVAVVVVMTMAFSTTDALAQRNPTTFNVLPITITSVTADAGELVANGTIGVHSIRLPLVLRPRATSGACPILDLSLGPINLSVLGLNVDTSPICLEITAMRRGGLLGDLLCSLSKRLLAGESLADILASLSTTQSNTLNAGLTTVLNQVLAPLTASTALVGATCEVLSLSVGPLSLDLLGLNVRLDDCSGGPVTVDITADPAGGLLGDLLCSLADAGPDPAEVLKVLRRIVVLLGRLIG